MKREINMEHPLVSMIIPVYNHAAEARRQLVHVEAQSYRPIEVILVDDGSTDGLREQIQDIHPTYPLAFIRQDTNKGAPAARNEGFRRSKGAFVLFLDADVKLEANAILKMVQALGDHPEASFAYAPFRFGGKLFRGQEFDPEALKRLNYIHTTSLIRREDFPGFDESLKRFQDWDLWLTMAEQGKKGIRIDHVLFSVGMDLARGIRMSTWLPRFMHRIPWEKIGWMPSAIKKYREAEAIIRKKHGI
jgi:glycosyltransferase involved in cell wall biosynthesis